MMDIGEVAKNNTSVGGEGVHKAHPENNSTPSTDFVLQWGSRKRLRCMKIQVKNDSTTERTRVRVSRAVVRTTRDSSATATATTTTNNNFRRPFSPPHPLSHRNPRGTSHKGFSA